MNWYLAVLKKYAVFDGRARRTEFWMFHLINLFICAAYVLAHRAIFPARTSYALIGGAHPIVGMGTEITWASAEFLLLLPLLLFGVAIYIPSFAVTVRRLHDTGRSGGFWLISAVPYIGVLILWIVLARDSQPGKNEYGPNPKDKEMQE
jgi:uncharacterized membrane protein YhaH (DUF805 family)